MKSDKLSKEIQNEAGFIRFKTLKLVYDIF